MTNANTNATTTQEQATTKMYKKDWFEALKTIVKASDYADKEGAIAFLDHEKEMLEKKSSKSGMTKIQKENLTIIDTIKAVLADLGRPVTITELQKDDRLNMYTPQKIAALVRKLLPSDNKNPNGTGEVIRVEEKKTAYFSLATATPTITVELETAE